MVIAYVLAGGQSRRMGRDKLSLIIDGMSLLDRTVTTCSTSFEQVMLVAPKPGKLSGLGYPVVLDSPIASGPMAGVIAALEDCSDDCCFLTAADLFDLSSAGIDLIVSRYQGQDFLGFEESRGIQPLCGIYGKSALAVLRSCAKKGEFKMRSALKQLNVSRLALPPGLWRNINCPEDLKAVDGNNG
ncbi:MAG: molybdenum cofactor guanylyltransferase [candidate division Zixibacteria bacterium]